MEQRTTSGNPAVSGVSRLGSPMFSRLRRGYTIIEMVMVLAVIAILVSIAVPRYQKQIQRSRESVLRSNLTNIRQMIDEYTYDKQKAPKNLDDLVQNGYLRQIPVDPITGSNRTWRVVMEDAVTTVNQTEPGIYDVHSGSDRRSLEGTAYSEW